MCCFRLHFSDFIAFFFLKNRNKIEKLLQFTLEKITCSEEKAQPHTPPPPDIKWSIPKPKKKKESLRKYIFNHAVRSLKAFFTS